MGEVGLDLRCFTTALSVVVPVYPRGGHPFRGLHLKKRRSGDVRYFDISVFCLRVGEDGGKGGLGGGVDRWSRGLVCAQTG